jgi:hypothetical protein
MVHPGATDLLFWTNCAHRRLPQRLTPDAFETRGFTRSTAIGDDHRVRPQNAPTFKTDSARGASAPVKCSQPMTAFLAMQSAIVCRRLSDLKYLTTRSSGGVHCVSPAPFCARVGGDLILEGNHASNIQACNYRVVWKSSRVGRFFPGGLCIVFRTRCRSGQYSRLG